MPRCRLFCLFAAAVPALSMGCETREGVFRSDFIVPGTGPDAPHGFGEPPDGEPPFEEPPRDPCEALLTPPEIPVEGELPQLDPVVRAATPPPPLSGGTLAVFPAFSRAVAADPDRDRVFIAGVGEVPALLATIPLQPRDEPGRVVIRGDGRAYVSLRRGGAVAVIDVVAGALTARWPICPAPRGLALDPAGAELFVACDGGEVLVLDATTGEVRRQTRLAPGLRDAVYSGDTLYVSYFRSAEMRALRPADLTEVDRTRPRVVFDSGGNVFEPSQAWRMVSDGLGGVVLLHQRGRASEITGISEPGAYDSSGADGGGGGGGTFGGEETSRRCEVSAATMTPWRVGSQVLGVVNFPSALPLDFALVNGRAFVVSPNTMPGALGGTRFTGVRTVAAPRDEFTAPGSDEVCLHAEGAFAEAKVGTAIAVASLGDSILVLDREPAQLLVFEPGVQVPYETRARIPLSDTSVYDTGHALFHLDPGAGLSCASCHGEGQDDGRTWHVECVGQRRTQPLDNGLMGTEPFHWSGDVRDIYAVVGETMIRRMDGPAPSRRQVEAMLEWLDNLEPPPASAPVDPLAVARGEAVFEASETGCASCHAGPRLGLDQTVEFGTGGAFQIPSLLQLARRPPYMHAGCAPELATIFLNQMCGGGHVPATAHLTSYELDDLVAYLESL